MRTAVSLGGDCDTLTDISAAMGEAYYGIPFEFVDEIDDRLPKDLLDVVKEFNEIRNLRRGHIPMQMEDKCFFYMKRNRLYAHRSWTGYLIFVIEFDFNSGIHKVTMNRDPEQYNSISVEDDTALINECLNWLLTIC